MRPDMSCPKQEIEKIKGHFIADKNVFLKDVVFERMGNHKSFAITWCRSKKKWCIDCPEDNTIEFFDLDMLHEYVHLKQKYLLSSEYNNPFINWGDLVLAEDIAGVATDWYVNAEIVKLCKDEAFEKLKHDFKSIKNQFSSDCTDSQYLIAGLTFAEAKRWLNYNDWPKDEKLKKIINAISNTDPCLPCAKSINNLIVDLINTLGHVKAELKKDDEGQYISVEGVELDVVESDNRKDDLLERFF
jgi:hypothetical protein